MCDIIAPNAARNFARRRPFVDGFSVILPGCRSDLRAPNTTLIVRRQFVQKLTQNSGLTGLRCRLVAIQPPQA